MTKPEAPLKPEVINLGAPQPHEIPQGEYEAVLEKKDVPDQGIDMKKALEIVSVIYDGDKTQRVGTKMECVDILKHIAISFKNKDIKLAWEQGELVIKTGIKQTKTHSTFKTLEEILGNDDLAKVATAKLLIKELQSDHLATK